MISHRAQLLHIESSASSEDEAELKAEKQAKNMTSDKYESFRIERSLFHNQEWEEKQYIIEDSAAMHSNIKNRDHQKRITENPEKQGHFKQKEEDEQDLERIELTQSAIQRQRMNENKVEENKQELLLAQTLRKSQAILFEVEDSSSESEAVQVEVSSEDEEEDDEEEEEETQLEEGDRSQQIMHSDSQQPFFRKPLGFNQCLKLILKRMNSGINYFLPEVECFFMENLNHVLSAKKQLGTSFIYAIYQKNSEFGDADKIVARVCANFSNSIFNLFDYGKDGVIVCTQRLIDEPNTETVFPKCIEIYLLREDVSYWSLAGVDSHGSDLPNLFELYAENKDKIVFYRNRKPEFSPETNSFILNFGGRVSKGSVKNFILEDKNGKEIMMFGKGKDDLFNLFVSHPLSPLIAMGIGIAQFSSRIVIK